ncbi:hypothetical protein EON79_07235 [bacterium]|nr:MAG: hypothetical protein EON79_07235 [bacterium]
MLPLLLAFAQSSSAALVLSVDSVAPGGAFTAAIRIKMEPGWHTYWKNPGDSGSAPTVKWALPSGWRVSNLRWPLPTRHKTAEGTDYVYENEVLLLAEITAPQPGARPTLDSEAPIPVPPTATLKAKVSWLVCQEACVPASADVSAPILVGRDKPSKDSAQLAELVQAIPARVLDGWKVKATPTGIAIMRTDGEAIQKGTVFLPAESGLFDHSDPGTLSADGMTLSVKRSEYAKGNPKRVRGVIVLPNQKGMEIDLSLSS